MPARGGLADLTDAEIRSAVVYMFNPVSGATRAAAIPLAAVLAANRRTVGRVEVYLGVVSAEALRAQRPKRDAAGTMHGGIPSGKGYYHVNISLIDSETKGEITDAKVEVTVEDPVMRSETKALELIAIDNRISYGNYFQMPGKDPTRSGCGSGGRARCRRSARNSTSNPDEHMITVTPHSGVGGVQRERKP